jgi:uncharacterized protein
MATTSTFTHGVYYVQEPTAAVGVVEANASLPFVCGRAPVHTLPQFQWQPYNAWAGSGSGVSPYASVVNQPIMTNSYQDVVNGSDAAGLTALGFSTDFANWTISEHVDAAYLENNVAPAVYQNVFDPAGQNNYTVVAPASFNISNNQAVINTPNVILTSVVVKNAAGSQTFVNGTDYVLNYDSSGTFASLIVTVLAAGAIGGATTIQMSYAYALPQQAGANAIIGGTDAHGNYSGLQAIENVFWDFQQVVGIILCPGFSSNPNVAQAMLAKATSFNGVFSCMAYIDVDTTAVTGYTGVNAWKNANNIFSKYQQLFWPMAELGTKTYHLSTLAAVTQAVTDFNNGNVPYASSSNQPLAATALVLASGAQVTMTNVQANSLNQIGCTTALNFIGGFRLWGNQTAAYPADTDIHDEFACIQRMFQFVGNSLVLTLWQFVDRPGSNRNVESVTETITLFLDALVSQGALIDGNASFNPADNPLENLMSGTFSWNLQMAPPPPMQTIRALLNYDLNMLQELFTNSGIANPTSLP